MIDNYTDCLNRINFTKKQTELVFFDVGCNINNETQPNNEELDDFTYVALLQYPNAKCYGIEPLHWQNYEDRWKDNDNVTLIKKALSDKDGKQDFYVPPVHGLSSLIYREIFKEWQIPTKTEVDCITLDSLSDKMSIDIIDYLKLDTEGSEMLILKGSENMLRNGRISIIQMEWGCWSDIGMNISQMDDYLIQYNFSNIHQNSTEVLYALN